MRRLPPLGVRQRLVLDRLPRGAAVRAVEVGAWLHDRRWRRHCGRDGFGCRMLTHHPQSERCEFCDREGVDVLLALHRRGLVSIVDLSVVERDPEAE